MLKIVEVATYLTEKLNEISNTQTDVYSFNIQAEVGANKNAKDVQGIVRTISTKIAPRTNGRNAIYNLVVEFPIMSPTTNFNLVNIENCINLLAKEINGTQIAFESGKAIVTMGAGVVKDFKTDVGQGNVVPLSFEMSLNYTENVVAIKHWVLSWYENETLVSEEIPYISEQLIVEKEGRTNRIHDENYSKTLVLGQKHWYRFTFEYDANSKVCKKLQKDLFEGNANEKYTLSYYDDVIYTKTAPYETKVSVFTTGNGKSNFPNTADFDITFVDVEDGKNNTKYYLALCNNPFDKGGENTRCFSATSETIVGENNEPVVVTHTAQENQIAWYSALIQTDGADYDEIPAANISNIQLTDQVYINTRNYDLFDIVNMNYAIIKVVQGTGDNIKEHYFYYWTSNPQIGVNGQVSYTLELDSLQTYLFDPDFEIDDAFISQAHLNRWVKNLDGSISFDGTADSKLFERENLKNIAKRLKSRTKLYTQIDTTQNSALNTWLDTNVYAWVYIYLTTASDNNGHYSTSYSTQSSNVSLDGVRYSAKSPTSVYENVSVAGMTPVLCYPITKQAMYVVNDTGTGSYINIGEAAVDGFVYRNDGFSYVANVKLSIKPPFPTGAYTKANTTTGNGDYAIINNELIWLTGNSMTNDNISVATTKPYANLSFVNFGFRATDNIKCCLIYDRVDTMLPLTYYLTDTTILPKIKFTVNEVAGVSDENPVSKDIKFNPKLNNLDYKELRVGIGGDSETYSLQKLNNQNPSFEYYEPLSGDVTKGMVQYKSTSNDEIYNLSYSKSYNGFSYTNDLSLPTANSQINSYFANNKNAYLSFQNQQQRQRTSAQIGIMGGILETAATAALAKTTGGASALTDDISGGAVRGIIDYFKVQKDQEYQQKQFDLTIDDMASAPFTLQNVNGSAILTTSISDLGIYAELYEALPHELQMANEDMYRDGFTYNLIDDIYQFINAPVYDGTSGSKHIRRYFNYVKAVINNINGVSISNQARDDIRLRLANGVRFWHQDTIDYEHENYELWLNSLRT